MTHPNPVDSAVEQPQNWYFTFGHGQKHRVTGEDLMGSYVVINGTYDEARQQMVSAFGTRWCDQYGSAENAGVERFKLRRIELPTEPVNRPVKEPVKEPVTPAEERTGVSDVQHAFLADLRRLDAVITDYGNARAANARGEHAAYRKAQELNESIAGLLDRIEAWVRGGAS